jgi:hypothetical protein
MEEGGSPRALRLARMYALALRGVLAQQTDGTYLFRRDWLNESFDFLDSIDDRTICVGRVLFSIEVPDVLEIDAGPLAPEAEPYPIPSPEWPTAFSADVEVEKVPLTEDVQP